MKRACRPFALLLAISTPVSAEEVPATVLPPPQQVELPPVDASILKAAKQQASSVAPQQLQVKPGINELIPIAIGHLNRLVTPFDNPVVTTTSQATTSSKGKIVYVATADETPVTLYITPGDNQDIALSLTLIPKHIPAREIHLSLDKDTYKVLTKLQQQATSSGKSVDKEQDYITTLKKLFRDLGLQKTPPGFSLRDPGKTEHIRCQQDRVQIRTGQLLEGQDLVILVGVARNNGTTSIEFDERACATTENEVLAVAVWPKVVLGPNESTELYVAIRRSAEQATTLRPSLLNRSAP